MRAKLYPGIPPKHPGKVRKQGAKLVTSSSQKEQGVNRNVWTRSSTTSPPPHCPCFLPPRTFLHFGAIGLFSNSCIDIPSRKQNEIPFNSRGGHGGLCSSIIGRCICAFLAIAASSAKQCCCQCPSSHRHCLVLFCILTDDDGNSEHRPAHPNRLRSEESAAGAR